MSPRILHQRPLFRARPFGGPRRHLRALLLGAVLTVAASPLLAQTYAVRPFGTEDGLSQGSVLAIIEDRHGFIWIGTHDGLNRFDGVRFTVFRHVSGDTTSISNNQITSLQEDSAGSIWVGTVNGLNRFRRDSESFDRIPCLLPGSGTMAFVAVNALADLRLPGLGGLVMAGQGIWVFDSARHAMTRLVIADSVSRRLLEASVNAMAADHAGFLWLGNGQTLLRYNSATRLVDREDSLGGLITSLSVIPGAETLLLVTTVNGVEVLGSTPGSPRRSARGYTSVALEETRRERYWLGTRSGLQQVDIRGNTPVVTEPTGLNAARYFAGKDILTLCRDRAGGIWVGTYYSLFRLDPFMASFENYRHDPTDENSLSSDFVMPILEDRSGALWFGTFDAGVSVRSPDGASWSRALRSLPHGNVRSLLEDRSGHIWVGSAEGIHRISPATREGITYSTIPSGTGLPAKVDRALWCEVLHEGRDGAIWAGLNKGLVRVRPGREQDRPPLRGAGVVRFHIADAEFEFIPLAATGGARPAASTESHAIAEDRFGDLWIGTEDGLVRYRPATGAMERFRHDEANPNSLSHDYVWSIFEDPAETSLVLWVGTSQGLDRFDVTHRTFRRYPEQEGFPNAWVYAILRDDWGRLWLSTNRGLTCFDDRRPVGRKFRNYDVSDGLPGNEFNRRSALRMRNGDFLFGGTRGVTRFNPLLTRDNPYVPPVVLTGFSKLGKRVPMELNGALPEVLLRYDENVFTIDFAALNFTNALRNRYTYMLQGYDLEWISAGTERSARYMNIDPGEYVFCVRGSNNDGLWNETGAMLSIRIVPPFWQRWWFRAAAVLLLPAGLFLYYRRRTALLVERERTQREFAHGLLAAAERERSRLAGELHDSLVQSLLVAKNLALIGLRSASEPAKVERELNEISDVVSGAIEEVRTIAHNLRPYQLDRLGLTKAIRSLGSSVNESGTVRFTLDIDDIDDCFRGEQAILVYRIVQEGISNIMKHSGASAASISARCGGAGIDLSISDNGRGLPQAGNDPVGAAGFGLSGIGQRVQMLGGSYELRSGPGAGTELLLHIPHPRPMP